MKNESDVSFKNQSRIHFGLKVRELEKSIAFYQALFQAPPKKVKNDYAKFELDDPSINLALDYQASSKRESAVTHFGIQVKSAEHVEREAMRLERAGWPIDREEEVVCCYATQSKAWATDPDGNRWEIFVVTDYDQSSKSSSSCCQNDNRKNLANESVACC